MEEKKKTQYSEKSIHSIPIVNGQVTGGCPNFSAKIRTAPSQSRWISACSTYLLARGARSDDTTYRRDEKN